MRVELFLGLFFSKEGGAGVVGFPKTVHLYFSKFRAGVGARGSLLQESLR